MASRCATTNPLFDEVNGPLRKRREPDGVGGFKAVAGAQCVACEFAEVKEGSSWTKKTERFTMLGHLAAIDGDPGGGWVQCPLQCATDASLRVEWRAEFLKLAAEKKAKKRRCSEEPFAVSVFEAVVGKAFDAASAAFDEFVCFLSQVRRLVLVSIVDTWRCGIATAPVRRRRRSRSRRGGAQVAAAAAAAAAAVRRRLRAHLRHERAQAA